MTNARLARLVTLLTLGFAGVAAAADPFYERLLRDGSNAYNHREFQTAARLFRIACFGFLDEPTLLADGLVRLGLAQAAAGDAEGFRETFQRLAEVEERFQGYTKAEIPPEMRTTYEHFVAANIPEATLTANSTFARLLPTTEERLAQLAPKERRRELERLIAREPNERKWRLMLGSLALADGDAKVAREQADAVLTTSKGDKEALRLRGLAFAREKEWTRASADLQASGTARGDVRVAEALLLSLVQLEQWQEASALGAQLAADVRKQGAIPELVGRADDEIAKARAAAAKPTPTPTATRAPKATSTPTPAATKTPARPTPTVTPTATTKATSRPPSPTSTATPRTKATATPTPTASPRPTVAPTATPTPRIVPTAVSLTSPPEPFADELARARDLAAQDRLTEAFAAAQAVADAHPESVEAQHLAGEIAYRGARWSDAVTYFRRGGDPGVEQPLRLFYLAVSLYESGDRDGAAAVLKRCLPRIRKTDYVEQYRRKILGQ